MWDKSFNSSSMIFAFPFGIVILLFFSKMICAVLPTITFFENGTGTGFNSFKMGHFKNWYSQACFKEPVFKNWNKFQASWQHWLTFTKRNKFLISLFLAFLYALWLKSLDELSYYVLWYNCNSIPVLIGQLKETTCWDRIIYEKNGFALIWESTTSTWYYWVATIIFNNMTTSLSFNLL